MPERAPACRLIRWLEGRSAAGDMAAGYALGIIADIQGEHLASGDARWLRLLLENMAETAGPAVLAALADDREPCAICLALRQATTDPD